MKDSSKQISIRLVRQTDCQQVSELCCQLGYPSTSQEIEQRVGQIQQDERHVVYVADNSNRQIIGWIHVYVCPHLQTDLQAEVGGLIVDASDHSQGIGSLLVQQAEQWAYQQGCNQVLVRSNIIRQEAHNFYKKIGYNKIKTSLVFHKVLSAFQ